MYNEHQPSVWKRNRIQARNDKITGYFMGAMLALAIVGVII